jgi:hypothetical protein
MAGATQLLSFAEQRLQALSAADLHAGAGQQLAHRPQLRGHFGSGGEAAHAALDIGRALQQRDQHEPQ